MGIVALILFIAIFMGLSFVFIWCFLLYLIAHCVRSNLTREEKKGIILRLIFSWYPYCLEYCRDHLKMDPRKVLWFLYGGMTICLIISGVIIKKTIIDPINTQNTPKVGLWKKLPSQV